MKIKWLGVVFLFILLIGFLYPGMNQFFYQPNSQFNDITITHYSNLLYLQNAIRNEGVIPLWSDQILSGYPFYANPLSGLHYPPGWIALLFPLPLGINITAFLHLIFGALGMYLLLRKMEINQIASFCGSIVFLLFPKFIAHLAAGHLTLIYAIAWTPWILLAEINAQTKKTKKGLALIPGLLIGISFLADPRWSVYAGFVWIFFSFTCWVRSDDYRNNFFKKLGKWFLLVIAVGMTALLIAMPLLLPMVEYTSLSTRSLLTPQDNTAFSLDPIKLIGLWVPDFGGNAEYVLYPGSFGFLFLVYAVVVPEIRKKTWHWVVFIALIFLFAMGSNLPGLEKLYSFSFMSFLRVPSRAIFLTAIPFSIVTALCMEYLFKNEKSIKPEPLFFLFPVTIFLVLFATGVFISSGSISDNLLWGTVYLVLSFVCIWMMEKRWQNVNLMYLIFFFIFVSNYWVVNIKSVTFKDTMEVFSEGSTIADYLKAFNPERIYSPSYSISQQAAANSGLHLADGIDPLQLKSYAAYMEGASGVASNGYSVTIPYFKTANPKIDNRYACPDLDLLGNLSVQYIVAEYDLSSCGLISSARVGDTRIYSNPNAKPLSWVQKSDQPIGNGIIAYPQKIIRSINQLSIDVNGPGLLVVSIPYYPDWHINLDGKEQQNIPINDLFMGLELSQGQHHIEFNIIPATYYVGIVISLITLIIILIFSRK